MNAAEIPGAPDSDFIDIHQQRVLAIDASRAGAALGRYVEALGTGSLRLKASVWLPNLGAAIELRDEVVATLLSGHRDGATGCANVTWFGTHDGPFPRLHGQLWIAPASTWTSTLRFDARYRQMPSTLRLAAAAEGMIGHRIILATARVLLRDVAAALAPGAEEAATPPVELRA